MATKRKITPEGRAFGERLIKAREHAKLEVRELAEAIGVKWQAIQAIEGGFVQRSGYTAQMAHRCGVSPLWLATGDGGMLDNVQASSSEQTLLLDYRAIDDEEGKNQVRANIRYWLERRPIGGVKPLRRSRTTRPPGDARRGTKGRGSGG